MRAFLMSLSFAALVLGQSVRADDNKKDDGPVDDKTFATKAAAGGAAEVKFAEFAQKNAQSEKVKEFARMMVKDHTKANEELMAAAKAQNVNVSNSLPPKKQEAFDKLSKLQAEFDQEYMKMMVEGHEKMLKLFEGESKNGTDGELKKFAEKCLPTIREHLTHAKEIADSAKGKDK